LQLSSVSLFCFFDIEPFREVDSGRAGIGGNAGALSSGTYLQLLTVQVEVRYGRPGDDVECPIAYVEFDVDGTISVES